MHKAQGSSAGEFFLGCPNWALKRMYLCHRPANNAYPTRKTRGSSLRRQTPPKTDVYLQNALHSSDNRQTGDVLKDQEVRLAEAYAQLVSVLTEIPHQWTLCCNK